jgi:CRP/FNR family cyclic AMP-dependent transcriptional regulator
MPHLSFFFTLGGLDLHYDMISLESHKLFRDLSPAELEQLHGATRELTFAAQQPIFRQGDPGDGIYFVKEGLVEIATTVSTGESKELSKIAAGALFGEMAVLDNEPRSASATANRTTTVYFISRDELLKLLDRIPRLVSALVREISGRMRTFNDKWSGALPVPLCMI